MFYKSCTYYLYLQYSSLYSKKDSDFDNWNIFKIRHYDKVQKYDDLKDAKLSDESKSETVDLNAYVSPAKAVLMDDTEVSDNEDGNTDSFRYTRSL